jgi:hemerythrin
MAIMQWNDKLSVKVEEIDKQHKKLVNLINQLHDAMAQGKSKEIMSEILKELANYTVEHFSTEEKYFKQFNYPDAAAHIAEHKKFVDTVKQFQNEFNSGKVMLSMKIMNFLKDWLINHIMGTDQKYSAFFNEKGLK